MNPELNEALEKIQALTVRMTNLERETLSLNARYMGPRGPKGDKGDRGEVGPSGKDGKDSAVDLIDQRNDITEELQEHRTRVRAELGDFRKELRDYQMALHAEMEKLYRDYENQLSEIYDKETGAFCALRDKACEEIRQTKQ